MAKEEISVFPATAPPQREKEMGMDHGLTPSPKLTHQVGVSKEVETKAESPFSTSESFQKARISHLIDLGRKDKRR